jgi:nitrite reductase (cytochrome c-552)
MNRTSFNLAIVGITAVVTVGILLLLQNILRRQSEAEQVVFNLLKLSEDVRDPKEWGKNFPRQYDSYQRSVDTQRTKHGGNEAVQKLDEDPALRVLFKGYAFGKDYREERGHAFMLSDQDHTERVTEFKQKGACLHCHADVTPAYRALGEQAGVASVGGFEPAQVMKGFEMFCALPLDEARKMVDHPVVCADCHDPESMQLRVTRPGFINGIAALAASTEPLPHLRTIEEWRKSERKTPYDPNQLATRQEMRSFVCGQCHVEYYFKGEGKLVTYPWEKGIRVEHIQEYYDEAEFKDWVHADSGAPLLKAQHPEFELWNQCTHARSGVACADCHMPYLREGAIKISDHQVRSPLLNASKACQVCHRYSAQELEGRVELLQDRTRSLLDRGETALVELIAAIDRAKQSGQTYAQLAPARKLHREAQFRLDFIAADNSMGFHAAQESARIMAEAIDLARQGEIALLRPAAEKSKSE